MTARHDNGRVELFTQRHCAVCRAVEAFLRERDIPYVLRDIGTDTDALRELTDQGFMSTPVLRLGEAWVAGFDRRAIQQLLE